MPEPEIIQQENEKKNPEQNGDDKGIKSETQDEQLRNLPEARSFMAIGATSDEQKERVATGVRNTLLMRMEQENSKSESEAMKMAEAHADYSVQGMEKAAEGVQGAMKQALMAETKALILAYGTEATPDDGSRTPLFEKAQSTLNAYKAAADTKGTGEDKAFYADQQKKLNDYGKESRTRFSPRYSYRVPMRYMARTDAENKKTAAKNAIGDVRKAAEVWNGMLRSYHDNVYKPINDTYDRLFMAYYTMSRNMKDENGNPDLKLTNPNAEKKIAEYRGVFREDDINAFEETAKNGPEGIGDPYASTRFNIDVSEPEDASTGTMEGMNMVHSMVSAEGVATRTGQVPTERIGITGADRIRYMIDKDFNVFRSGFQYNDNGQIEKNDQINPQEKIELQNANLIADEKVLNGAEIFSQSSSKVYRMITRAGGVVEGFFIGGEFVPSNPGQVQDQGGYAAGSNPSQEYIAEREKFRIALRQSDFFDHINDKSIVDYYKFKINEEGIPGQSNDLTELTTSGNVIGPALNMYLTAIRHFWEFSRLSALYDINPEQDAEKEAMVILRQAVPTLVEITGIGIDTMTKNAMEIGKRLAAAAVVINTRAMQKGLGRIPEPAKNPTDEEKTKNLNLNKERNVCIMAANQAALLSEEIINLIAALSDLDTSRLGADVLNTMKESIASTKVNVKAMYLSLQMSATSLNSNTLKADLETWKAGESNIARLIQNKEEEKKNDGEVKKNEEEAKKEPPEKEKVPEAAFKTAPNTDRYLSQFVIRWGEAKQGEELLDQLTAGNVPKSKISTKEVLAEETGIKSAKHLADISKVYAAIDLYSNIMQKDGRESDELAALKMMTAYISKPARMTYPQFKKTMRFDRIRQAVGAPSNWRDALMAALSTK